MHAVAHQLALQSNGALSIFQMSMPTPITPLAKTRAAIAELTDTLRDHPITVVDQVDEQIEDLRSDIDQLGAAPQLAAIHVDRIFTELKWHSGLLLRRWRRGRPRRRKKQGYFRGKSSPCQSLAHWAPASSDTMGATMTTAGRSARLSAM